MIFSNSHSFKDISNNLSISIFVTCGLPQYRFDIIVMVDQLLKRPVVYPVYMPKLSQ